MAVRAWNYPNILSVCTGGGGLDLGIRLAVPASRAVCYVEREAYAVSVLAAAIQKGLMDNAPIWDDLRTFDGGPWRGVVDWVAGGIPCQPHSVAGRGKGADDSRDLWSDTRRIIGEIRPSVVFLENVPGIMQYYRERIQPDLQGMGYGTQEGLFSAAEVEAPHERQRFFVLAYSGSESAHDGQGALDRPLLCARGRNEGQLGTDASGAELAYTDSWTDSRSGNTEQRRWGEFADKDISVAHTSIHGLRGDQAQRPWQQFPSMGSPYWPPGPNDLDSWAHLLSEMPSLEPAFCRDADGMAHWLDASINRANRLRLLGNGVVPMVAATALRTLMGRASGG